MQQFSSSPRRLFSIDFTLPKHLRVPILTSFVLSLSVVLLAVVFYFLTQPVIPLFYSLAQPHEYLAPKEWLFIFPVFSLAITFLHFFLLHLSKGYEKVIPELFAWTTVVVQAMTLIALLRILLIIT